MAVVVQVGPIAPEVLVEALATLQGIWSGVYLTVESQPTPSSNSSPASSPRVLVIKAAS